MHLVKRILKITIFLAFFVLFVSENETLHEFTDLINKQIIRPYYKSVVLKNSPPTIVEVEVTPILDNTQDEAIPNISRIVTKTPPRPTNAVIISTEELLNELNQYRKSHNIPTLEMSDKLCSYAQKRADELYIRLQTNPEDPLDHHAGFQRDADSGDLFKETGFTTVGENLAFVPSYTTAVQIIEWGWDTSSGHRELQLSTDVRYVCIIGKHPVYVGIYAK